MGRLLGRVARASIPRVSGRVELSGLEARVEVVRDRFGVPHVYADHLPDLARAVGYVQAQDRLFQMELLRRFAYGRLAELAGPRALEIDRFVRRLRLGWAARRDAKAADGAAAEWASAYAEGVNAFLAAGPLPLELRLARARPEPWSAVDVFAPGQALALGLSVNWEAELARMRVAARVGRERAAQLEPELAHDVPVIVPPELAERASRPAGAPALGASNSWAVAASRSATGAPLLANDPHLELTVPGIWYAQHLELAGASVAGFSVPGTGVVVLGRTRTVAWGFTAANVDTQDLYVERFDRERRRYLADGEWLEPEIVREEIRVRGRRRPAIEAVLVTRHGPLVAGPDGATGEALALRWSAHEPGRALGAFLDLMDARTVEDADRAFDRFTGPPQNVVLADADGTIAYRLAGGPIPARRRGEGLVPAVGWTSDHEWRGWVAQADLPRFRNPERGSIVTANNRIVGDDYPHFLGWEHLNGYRARRIEELLDELEAVTVEDCRRIQLDQRSLPGLELAAIARTFEADTPAERRALDLLRAWDGELGADSVAGAVYSVLMRQLELEAYAELGSERERFLGAGETEATVSLALFERTRPVILRSLAERDDSFFADGRTWDDVFRAALAATVRELGPGLGRRPWGELHRVGFRHPFGEVPLLGRVFNRGPYPAGGDADTVWQMAWRVEEPYGPRLSGPSMRAVYDLGDPNGTSYVLAAGQSAHVASPHFDDFVERWRAGELVELPMTRGRVDALAASRLALVPAGSP